MKRLINFLFNTVFIQACNKNDPSPATVSANTNAHVDNWIYDNMKFCITGLTLSPDPDSTLAPTISRFIKK